MKLAVVTDLHCAKQKNTICKPERYGECGIELLGEVVNQLNESIFPDILLIGGDLVNSFEDTDLLKEIAHVLASLRCSWIVIPGNHDPAPEIFYRYLPMPPEYIDVKGIRIVPFPEDIQTKECNAIRSKKSMEKLEKIDNGLPIIMFQHVPLFYKGRIACPYNYKNADEVILDASRHHVVLSISGHFHTGYLPFFYAPFPSLAVPALCEKDFSFTLLDLNHEGKIISCTLQYLDKSNL